MLNPDDEQDMARLDRAWEHSRTVVLRDFRAKRLEHIKAYVGQNYAPGGSDRKRPANGREFAVTTYVQNLVRGQVRCMLSTDNPELFPKVWRLESAVNQQLVDMRFTDTLEAAVLEALFCAAWLKMGIAPSDTEVEYDGLVADPGQPFADVVTVDHMAFDPRATRWDRVAWSADAYTVPLDDVRDDPRYENAQDLTADDEHDDMAAAKEVLGLGSGNDGAVRDTVTLRDFWSPRDRIVFTLPLHKTKPILVMPRDREEGPLHDLLGFFGVPGMGMPLPFLASIGDLADSIDKLYRKMLLQAENQKTVRIAPAEALRTASVMNAAGDLETIYGTNAERIKEYPSGGVAQATLVAATHLRNVFNEQAGNLPVIAGTSQMADTLGQENILNANSSRRLEAMQAKLIAFAERAIRRVCYYVMNNPRLDRQVTYALGNNVEVNTRVTAEDVAGNMKDYNLRVDPYALFAQTPASRSNDILALIQQLALPFAQAMQADGITVDWAALWETIARQRNLPELRNIIHSSAPSAPSGNPSTQQGPTKRQYERISRSVQSPQQQEQEMLQALPAGGDQMSVGAG